MSHKNLYLCAEGVAPLIAVAGPGEEEERGSGSFIPSLAAESDFKNHSPGHATRAPSYFSIHSQ